MRHFSSLLLAALCIFSVNSSVFAQAAEDAEAKRADIRKLLELNGSGDLGKQMVTQMVANFRTSMPQVPKDFWDEFEKEANPNALVEMVIPSWEKNLTHDDIKELIKFYESPVGRKLVQAQPAIVQDSMAAGQKWGTDLAMRLQQKLQEQQQKQQAQPNPGQ